MESRSHYSDTRGHPDVPETHRLVLRARGNHPAAPRIQRQDVSCAIRNNTGQLLQSEGLSRVELRLRTCVSIEGVQALTSLAVGGVDVTVSCSSTDQDGSSTFRTLHESQVSDSTVMHAELQVWALDQHDEGRRIGKVFTQGRRGPP